MFSKTDKQGSQPAGQPQSQPLVPAQGQGSAAPRGGASGAPSLISNNLTVTGNMKTEGEIQIDGTIEGDVHCGALTVGEKASITGEIVADRIIVHGNVSGRIRARQVQLATTAHVIGDVYHDTLAIEAGAFLEGHCKRNDSSGGTKTEPKLSTPAAKPASKEESASAS
ncbi:MAG: polymer-forming cytoskeletal protein [Alphaproteobacteria bacterium]